MLACITCPVQDPSQVGEARRTAVALARSLGFDDTRCGRAALIATEAAANLIKHAGGGELVLAPVRGCCPAGNAHSTTRIEQAPWHLDILALDKGPGITDLDLCLRDGYSTSATPGTGLGAIRRLSDHFESYSVPSAGTVLLARLEHSPPSTGNPQVRPPAFRIGGLSVPLQGEEICGDAYEVILTATTAHVVLADGLGHGPNAALAAGEAMRTFLQDPSRPPKDFLAKAHEALRSTRGAAVANATVDLESDEIRFAGVGNISASFQRIGLSRGLASLNGIVGTATLRSQEFVLPLHGEGSALLILHSDGIATHWKLDSYPGLLQSDPAVIAAVLHRDFRRARDDSSIVVLRIET